MLFADFSAGEIFGWVFGLLASAGAFLVAWFNNGTRLMKRVDELTTRTFQLQDQVSKLQDDSAACLRREADLKAELARTSGRLTLLEARQGVLPNPQYVPGIVIADNKGIVRDYSPSLSMFLGWSPDEMKGRPISTMVPPETMEQFSAAFAKAANGSTPDPTKTIYTYALAKDNQRVPVVLSVRRWSGDFDSLLTATIAQRLSIAYGAAPDPKESHP